MAASLNRFYLACVAPPDSRSMVELHRPINGGRVDTLCNVTAAATAWLLTGRDLAPPFSGAWETAPKGTGPDGVDRLVAYAPGDEPFDATHVVLMLHRGGRTLVVDSHWAEGRARDGRRAGATGERTGASPRVLNA